MSVLYQNLSKNQMSYPLLDYSNTFQVSTTKFFCQRKYNCSLKREFYFYYEHKNRLRGTCHNRDESRKEYVNGISLKKKL
jgi:hypothetical protein